MEVPIHNTAGEQVGEIELPAFIFEANINRGLMHQALVRQLANARQGTHKAKSRGEVNYSTAKIYRQKGTGNARHGSRRAPIFVGGGVAHGPKPRDYSKRMPRKMHRAALRSALSAKAQNADIVVLDQIELDAPKTKTMAAIQSTLVGSDSALLLLANHNQNVELSARNLTSVKTLGATYLNIRDLLGYRKLIVPMDALELLSDYLGEEKA
ncbi:MAG: 50S ribosomal protein L4 [Anaerolineae bacterium]|nr:50S ribosomal protein L4 [Anaerolineae bacterium]MCO5193903.1 50S ribosomal protein L4 [Anaerolineae bacterium]MCO5196230.1 50S ribosomal protein L4 [Anaerolineae bacterium]